MSYEHGRVLAVNDELLGSELVGEHAAGVLALTVEDAVDFDEDGGWLVVGDQVVAYTAVDDEAGMITLADPLAELGEDGDAVHLWDDLRLVVTTEKVAEVRLDGDDHNEDAIEASVASHLEGLLPEGVRGTTGESVLLELDGEEWRVVDVLGLTATTGTGGGGALQFYDQDVHTVAASGDQYPTLTHIPITGSIHMRWNELPQEPTEFSYTGRDVTVPDPTGLLVPGDRLWFMYAYSPGGTAIEDQPPAHDPPWWEDITCDPAPWGRPTGFTIQKENRPMGSPYGWYATVFGSVTVELFSPPSPPAAVSIYPVWRWPVPPVTVEENGYTQTYGYDFGYAVPEPLIVYIDDSPYSWMGHNANKEADANVMLGQTEFAMYAGKAYKPHAFISTGTTDQCAALNLANLELVGVQLRTGTIVNVGAAIGYTDVCAGSYWLGEQIRPTDSTTYGVATPYL